MISRRRTLLTLASLCALPRAALAAPVRYALVPDKSRIGFKFTLNGMSQTGTMPIERADIIIDPQQLSASRVDVTLNVARARTGLIFVTKVMTGPDVLDAAQFPTIRFVSRKIILGEAGRISGGAKMSGDLTLHGVTKPITLQAGLYRPRGTPADDLSQLDIVMNGHLNRRHFGASGFPDLVADTVTLNISARIKAAK